MQSIGSTLMNENTQSNYNQIDPFAISVFCLHLLNRVGGVQYNQDGLKLSFM